MEITSLARDIHAKLVHDGHMSPEDDSGGDELVQRVLDHAEVLAGVDLSVYEDDDDDDEWNDDLFDEDEDEDDDPL